MNRVATWLIPTLLLAISACGPDQAAQLLETAQFEERQTNRAHAKELYEQIVHQFPDSPAAEIARTRLTELADKP